METLRVNGLIIREVSVGDTDKIITVLTDTVGKITVSCKGVRSIKSRRIAASQLFSYGELLLGVRGGRYYLTDATVENSFFELNSSLESLCLAQYFCQVSECVTVENEDQRDILSLILNSFYVLCKKKHDIDLVKATFEMRLCAIVGFCPDLTSCQECGADLEGDKDACLDIPDGGLVCGDCALSQEAKASLIPLKRDILSALRYIVKAPAKKIFSFSGDREFARELSGITEKYLCYHLDRRFETLDFYHSVKGM